MLLIYITDAINDSDVESVDDVTDEITLGDSSDSESEIASDDEDQDPAGICHLSSAFSAAVTVQTNEASTLTSNVPSDLSLDPECAPCQPELNPFPKQKIGKKFRCFHATFYTKYQWIEYSVQKDSVYCFHCHHFSKHQSSSNDGRTFVSNGFRKWNKCYGSHTKSNKLLKHQLSSFHGDAVAEHAAYQQAKKQEQSVLGMLSDAHQQTVQENRHYLKTLCQILCLTTERHIAQRDNSQFRKTDVDLAQLDFGPNSGIFLSLLSLVAKHDKVVAKKNQNWPKQCKIYTPHSAKRTFGHYGRDDFAEPSVGSRFCKLLLCLG